MRVADCGCCGRRRSAGDRRDRRVEPRAAASGPDGGRGPDPAAVVLAALRGAGYAPVAGPAGDQNDPVVTVRRAPESQPAAVRAVAADGIVEVIAPDAGRVDPGNLAARLHTAPVPSQQQVQALVDRLRGADSGLGFALLPDEQVRLLAQPPSAGPLCGSSTRVCSAPAARPAGCCSTSCTSNPAGSWPSYAPTWRCVPD